MIRLATMLVLGLAGMTAGPLVLEAADAAEAESPAPPAEGTEKADGEAPAEEPDITFIDWDREEGEREGTASDRSPASPFGLEPTVLRRDAVPGYVELSTDRKIPGKIYTTRAKRLEIFNLERGIKEYVPVPALKSIEAVVEWARIERQWRFKEAGSPEKVYSGRTYPARMLAWRLTLRNDHVITGHILGQPLYVTREGETERWVLHKRQKGPVGGTLDELVYIRRVVLGKKAYTRAVKERKAKASAGPHEEEPAGTGGEGGGGDGAGGDPR